MKAVVAGALAAVFLTGQPLGAKARAVNGGHFDGSHAAPGMVRGQQPFQPFARSPLLFPRQPWMMNGQRSFRSDDHADRSHGLLYHFDGASRWAGRSGHSDHSRSGLYDFDGGPASTAGRRLVSLSHQGLYDFGSGRSWSGGSRHSAHSHSGLYDFDEVPASSGRNGRPNRPNRGLYDFD
jgi:hypothetical protein